MRAHLRHLENTIELVFVHPSAHWSPQPKWQVDRFSRFCTAYGTKCLHFTMGAPVHQKCPFAWGIWTSHVTHDTLGPCKPTTDMAPRLVQPCLHRWPQSVPIWFACFALIIVPSHVGVWTPCPPKSGTQMATWSFQPFLQGWLVWQTDRSCWSTALAYTNWP